MLCVMNYLLMTANVHRFQRLNRMKASSGGGEEEPDDPSSRAKRIARGLPAAWGGLVVDDNHKTGTEVVLSVEEPGPLPSEAAAAVMCETQSSPEKSCASDDSEELQIAKRILRNSRRGSPRKKRDEDIQEMREQLASLVRSVDAGAKSLEALTAALVAIAGGMKK